MEILVVKTALDREQCLHSFMQMFKGRASERSRLFEHAISCSGLLEEWRKQPGNVTTQMLEAQNLCSSSHILVHKSQPF